MSQQPSSWGKDLGRIGILWGVAMAGAIAWVVLDQGVPAWDPAEHLSFAMNHWWLLTHSNWLSPEGWRQLWMISPKYPPMFYLVTAGVHTVLGPGADQAMFANALFALVLMVATYAVGRHLFSAPVGLLAAALCLLMPRLQQLGLDYQLDYPLTALVMVAFACLTRWRDAKGVAQWGWMVAFGVGFGLALMTKQAALLFLLGPIAWVVLASLGQRHWGRVLQLLVSAIVTICIMVPWLSVNWVFQFSIVGNTNVQSAQAEGDPLLNTLGAWTYYWRDLPAAVSWPLLLVPLVGLAFMAADWWRTGRSPLSLNGTPSGRVWLLVYIASAYLLWSLILNKDPRYIAPYLPALAIFLAWGLAYWWQRWRWVTGITLALSLVVTLFNLFPVGFAPGANVAAALAPRGQHRPYLGQPYPHTELVDSVAQTQPYQISTIGGLRSTAAVNQHNVSYYGKLADYQVYGRQVGDRTSQLERDLRSLSWFYAQGPIDQPWPPIGEDATSTLARMLEAAPGFVRDRTWDLPDNTRLYLYRRQQFPVTVTSAPDSLCAAAQSVPRLLGVGLPAEAPPGQPLPITYSWVGSWEALREGMAVLTWDPVAANTNSAARPWIHDHGIGLGTLRPKPIQAGQTVLAPADIDPQGCFQVTERTATLPPETAVAGEYRLSGTYLNALTGIQQPLDMPRTVVTLNPQLPPPGNPDLDWVTQLRQVSQLLPQGPDYLDEVFDPLGRLNLYDPVQHYLVQAEQTLQWRWQQTPDRLDYGYGLVLAQVLQLKVNEAIAALEQLVELDADNPYVHAYLGFVNLYALRPGAAQTALAPALELAPESPEIQGLSALAALFRGNLWGAWQTGRTAIALLNNDADES